MSQALTPLNTALIADLGVPDQLFIGGQWRSAEAEKIPVENPSNAEVLAEVANADERDIGDAIEAAVMAQESWAHTSTRFRADLLLHAYDAVLGAREDFALLIALEMGKPLDEARGEVDYAADFLRWFAEEAPRAAGRYATAPNGTSRVMTSVAPVGPCLLITPWNFPLAMAARKVAPAIAAGCTMILKPAALTPLTSLKFAQVFADAGLPAGVLNVITTSSASRVSTAVIGDPRVRKVSFTGSTGVGRQLLALAAANITRTSMELGGNAPFVVFDDTDLAAAVDGAVLAKMRNNGQSCIGANRFYLQNGIAEEFTAAFVERLEALEVGQATDNPDVGPLIDDGQRESVAQLVAAAVEGGATLRCGGARIDGRGYFYAPTVLTDVPPDSPVLHNEIFGPVAPIVRFADEDEAARLANHTEFGLASYVYTENLDRALRMVERLNVGMVGINQGIVSNAAAPFGGVKASGLGREGGAEGLSEYADIRYAAIARR